MATVTGKETIPGIIQQKLRGLRFKLTGWVLMDGLVWVVGVLLVLLAFDMLVDRVFKMDFSQRVIMLSLMGLAVLAVAYWRLLRPIVQATTDDALILEVEDKNRELRENLISSVQLSRQSDYESRGMSSELAEATIQRGIEKAKSINFASALNGRRALANLTLLIVAAAILTGIGLGVAGGQPFLETWFRRNILLQANQWPQSTYLLVRNAADGEIVVAHGDSLRIEVEVEERSRIKDVQVDLETDDGRNRSVHTMKASGKLDGRERIFVFGNVQSEFRFRAKGGDDVTEWYTVNLVEAPSVVNLDLKVVLPSYVGSNRERILEGGGPHSVLQGSQLELQVQVNKPLSIARLKSETDTYGLLQSSENNLRYSLGLPKEGELQGGKFEFELVDLGGQASIRPVTFTVRTKPDAAPVVRARLQGISGLIIPRAVLPISFSATDQYGLTRSAVEFSWKGGDQSVATDRSQEIPFELSEGDSITARVEHRLDLRPESIPVGVTLRMHLLAWDNQPGEPEPGRSREVLLRVVSEDELRADLLRREVEQRNAFEQVYNNQLELQTQLKALAAALPEKDEDPAGQQQRLAEFFDARVGDALTLQRHQKVIGTNMAAVADRFEEFLVEAINNRLDESESEIQGAKSIKKRLQEEIIEPIRVLDANEVFAATQSVEQCRRNARNQAEFSRNVAAASEIQETILVKMRQILDAMEKSETFQEVVNRLIEIREREKKIATRIEKEKEKPGDFDFFDDEDDETGKDSAKSSSKDKQSGKKKGGGQ